LKKVLQNNLVAAMKYLAASRKLFGSFFQFFFGASENKCCQKINVTKPFFSRAVERHFFNFTWLTKKTSSCLHNPPNNHSFGSIVELCHDVALRLTQNK